MGRRRSRVAATERTHPAEAPRGGRTSEATTSPVRRGAGTDLKTLQNTAGNTRVARLVGSGAVQRTGAYELDFGPSAPGILSDRKLEQNNRLRSVSAWLAANYKKLKWLGLFDSENPTDRTLGDGIEWARTHIDMWLDADEALEDDLMADVRQVQQLGSTWLADKQQARFEEAAATEAKARDLGLGWLADAIAGQRRSIEQALASADAYFGKPLNRAGAKLDKSVASWKALLVPIDKALSAYEPIRGDYAEILDITRDALERYEPLPNKTKIKLALAGLERKIDGITRVAAQHAAPPRGKATTEDTLRAAANAYNNAVANLRALNDDMYGLGALQEEAVERARSNPKTSGGKQRTSLPRITQTQAATLPMAEMLVQAVREAKTPEWKQAAVDFVLGNLALGRPDHIHICGGGNTLVYRDRLIRGFMTVHLDSSTASQSQFGRVLYRETAFPVPVAVRGGVLHEVVPD